MSLPTPPSGILDKDRPWYRGKISDAQWDRLKAKLTGGTDAGGTSYSKFIDCTQSEADKIISNLKKDPRGYPQMYMPGGGESYQIMIDFYQWLKDSYLTDEPKEEDIPVEIEVVEVEQKQPEEPIVVKIEAPFEPTPRQPLSAPKTLRLPRRSGVIRPSKAKKKSAAERMAEAFDERLDDVLDSIKNPPEPAQPKQRKQKQQLVKIKKAVKPSKFKSNYKESSNVKPFENLGKYGFTKIKSALGRAADARRMAQEQGLPEQKKRFYAKRALGFEFGGDRVARVRGTFAKSPDATLDPALSKQERYTSGLFGTRSIRPAKGGSKFDGLTKQFQKLDDEQSETTREFNKTVAEIREALKKGNKLDKSIVDSKEKQEKIARDAANDAEAAAEEAGLEGTEDTARLAEKAKKKTEIEKKKKDGGGGWNPFRWLKNLKRTAGKWLRRLKNPRRTFQAIKRLTKQKLKKIPGVRQLNNWMKAKKPFQGIRNMFGGNKAGAAAKTADTAADVTKAVKAADAAGDAARTGGFFSRMLRPLSGLARNPLARAGSRLTGKALPVIGTVAAISTTQDRYAKMNDPEFQKMVQEKKERGETLTEEELYSNPLGVAIAAISGIPIAGLPALAAETLMGTDAVQQHAYEMKRQRDTQYERTLEGLGFAPDNFDSTPYINTPDNPVQITQGSDNRNIFQKMMDGYNDWIYGTNKMSEGGTVKLADGGVNAMVGEAGPELVTNGPGGVNPLQSLAPMIVSMREITKRAGTWADPIENMVRQITDPIAKQLNLPVLPATIDIGGGGQVKEQKELKEISGFGGGLLDKLKELFGGDGGAMGSTASSGAMGASLSGAAAAAVANDHEFLAEVKRLSQKYQIKEGDLLGLMASESGLNPQARNKSGATGLIQFMPNTARELGTSTSALYGMNRAEQMKYVEKYFDYWKLPKGATAGQLYATVFAPAYASKDVNTTMYSRADGAAYTQNIGLDQNMDGVITVGELGKRIVDKKKSFGITDTGISTPPTPPVPPAPGAAPLTPQPQTNDTGTGVSLLPLLTPPPAPVPQQPQMAFGLSAPFGMTQGTSLTQLHQLRLAQ